MKTKQIVIAVLVICSAAVVQAEKRAPTERTIELSKEQVENLVRRSYQYAALYNTGVICGGRINDDRGQ